MPIDENPQPEQVPMPPTPGPIPPPPAASGRLAMSFTKDQLQAQCDLLGPSVGPLPDGVDGSTLLMALAGNESSYGANVTPRHEPAFDVGGICGSSPEQAPLLAKYGSAAACSYGPWQLMFCNAPQGSSPNDFANLSLAGQYTVRYLNSLLERDKPQTIAEIGSMWNAGHVLTHPGPGVVAYMSDLISNYNACAQEEA